MSRVGIIGAGRWAGVHKQALRALGVPLAGVACASKETKARVEREWGVPATTDLKEFLSWEMEAVIIISPNYLHAEQATAALEAGKHVLVEKPMATTVEDCHRMLEVAAQTSLVLAVGLEMRVFSLFARVKELITSGSIGQPLHLKLDLWRKPYRSGASGWKADPEKLGSSILEEPIHYLDLARWYFAGVGEPLTVQAWATSREDRAYLMENLDVRLEFTGAQALVTRSIAAYGHQVDLKLVGEKGALHAVWQGREDMDLTPRVALTLHDNAGTRELEVTKQTGHAYDLPRQTEAFLRAIRESTPLPADGKDGLASVALSVAVARSLPGSSVERLSFA